jgi:hypothetical protein
VTRLVLSNRELLFRYCPSTDDQQLWRERHVYSIMTKAERRVQRS